MAIVTSQLLSRGPLLFEVSSKTAREKKKTIRYPIALWAASYLAGGVYTIGNSCVILRSQTTEGVVSGAHVVILNDITRSCWYLNVAVESVQANTDGRTLFSKNE